MSSRKSPVYPGLFYIGTFATIGAELEAGIYAPLALRISELNSQSGIVTRKGVSSSPASRAFIELLKENDIKSSVLEKELIESLGPPVQIQMPDQH